MEEGKYSEAIVAFEEIKNHRDSATKIKECETAILDEKYDAAVALMEEGKYSEAIAVFTEIVPHRDSADMIILCQYNAAVALMEAGKYSAAIAAFEAIKDYKDSAAKIKECETVIFSSATVGTYITFGSYEQDNNTANGKEDIEWLVLAEENGCLFVISRYALDCKPYNAQSADITWETCTLRRWLNNDFLNAAFSSAEQAMIPVWTVSADKNPSCSTDPGKATQDKVFLLSINEANRYFKSDSVRQCQPTDYAEAQGVSTYGGGCWWWLRSPGYQQNYAADVFYDGEVGAGGFNVGWTRGWNDNSAVRPAMWINLAP